MKRGYLFVCSIWPLLAIVVLSASNGVNGRYSIYYSSFRPTGNAVVSILRPSVLIPGRGLSPIADMHCAYCRQMGYTHCIRKWCYRSVADPGAGGAPSFGPGGSTLADIYCAYCRQRGYTHCIQKYCYRRASAIASIVGANGGIPTTGNVNAFGGPGGSSWAAMYCAYCRQRGYTHCIEKYCYGAAGAAAGFGAGPAF